MNHVLARDDAKAPSSSVKHRLVDRAIDEQRPDERTLESESAWSLLRETFECRDFDDSLVFAE
jgi:hypothetical protein